MNILIFTGPTLGATEVARYLPEATANPPAACGDIYRACRQDPPDAIGLIDGFFDHRLSVWHKELLWALDRGISVYGSASMGALRAAELARFGMIGVGRVFEWYLTGELEDDDEVAVVHESAERGYAQRSIAMVNIRETLRQAELAQILDERSRQAVIAAMKQLFYPQRTLAALHASARGAGLQLFAEWLAQRGIIDVKRLDACAMVQRMAAEQPARQTGTSLERGREPFEYTNAWHALREHIERDERR